jgi:hypothetical protein
MAYFTYTLLANRKIMEIFEALIISIPLWLIATELRQLNKRK